MLSMYRPDMALGPLFVDQGHALNVGFPLTKSNYDVHGTAEQNKSKTNFKTLFFGTLVRLLYV